MARIVVKCQYTGHYVFTGIETNQASAKSGGRIFCPYCVSEHVWTAEEARVDERRVPKTLVRQAS